MKDGAKPAMRISLSIAGPFYLSADSSGQSYFYLLKQCLFGLKLTGTLVLRQIP